MKLEEHQKGALELPDSNRASLATDLLISRSAAVVDEDDGIDEAHHLSKELDENRSAGCSWQEIKQALGRPVISSEHQQLLDAHRARVANGESTLHDWDSLRHIIGNG